MWSLSKKKELPTFVLCLVLNTLELGYNEFMLITNIICIFLLLNDYYNTQSFTVTTVSH